jgi:hypothetical protein
MEALPLTMRMSAACHHKFSWVTQHPRNVVTHGAGQEKMATKL